MKESRDPTQENNAKNTVLIARTKLHLLHYGYAPLIEAGRYLLDTEWDMDGMGWDTKRDCSPLRQMDRGIECSTWWM